MADQATVTRALMVPALVTAFVLVMVWLVQWMGISGFYAIPFAIVLTFLWLNPHVMVVGLPGVFVSTALVPNLPGSMTAAQALCMLLGVWGLFHRPIARAARDRWAVSDWGIFAFLGVCVLLMFTRGFGMRMLGGTKYGGFGYVILLGCGLAYLMAPMVRLNRKHVLAMAMLLAAGALIPFVVEISIILTGGRTSRLLSFFTILPEYTMAAMHIGEMVLARISSARTVGLAIIMAALMLPVRRPELRVARYALVSGGLALVMLSGFRSAFLITLMLLVGWYFQHSRHRAMAAVLVLGGFLAVWILAIILGRALPGPIQRVVSYLPGVDVDPLVAANAEASVTWRLEIWKVAVRHIPEHLLLGRGIVTDVLPLAWLRREFYATPEFYYEMKGYHSGPLSLLLDFGLPGFVAGSAFMIGMVAEGWRLYGRIRPAAEDVVTRFYSFLLWLTTATVVSYYVLVGDVRASFPELTVYGIALRLVGRHLVSRHAAAVSREAAALSPAGWPQAAHAGAAAAPWAAAHP